MNHKWKEKPIVHPEHAQDLERDAAALEFGAGKLDRNAAEEGAHAAYKRKHHSDALAHHAHAMRHAMSKGKHAEAEKHSALYELHMKALGLKFSSTPPASTVDQKAFKDDAEKFKPHPADQLLLKSLAKSAKDIETIKKYVDSSDSGLSEGGR